MKKNCVESEDCLMVSTNALKDLISMAIGDVTGEEAIEALKNLALEILDRPVMENKDEMIQAIIGMMEMDIQHPHDIDASKKFILLLKRDVRITGKF